MTLVIVGQWDSNLIYLLKRFLQELSVILTNRLSITIAMGYYSHKLKNFEIKRNLKTTNLAKHYL